MFSALKAAAVACASVCLCIVSLYAFAHASDDTEAPADDERAAVTDSPSSRDDAAPTEDRPSRRDELEGRYVELMRRRAATMSVKELSLALEEAAQQQAERERAANAALLQAVHQLHSVSQQFPSTAAAERAKAALKQLGLGVSRDGTLYDLETDVVIPTAR
jgi:uncharacterized membrane protein YccC